MDVPRVFCLATSRGGDRSSDWACVDESLVWQATSDLLRCFKAIATEAAAQLETDGAFVKDPCHLHKWADMVHVLKSLDPLVFHLIAACKKHHEWPATRMHFLHAISDGLGVIGNGDPNFKKSGWKPYFEEHPGITENFTSPFGALRTLNVFVGVKVCQDPPCSRVSSRRTDTVLPACAQISDDAKSRCLTVTKAKDNHGMPVYGQKTVPVDTACVPLVEALVHAFAGAPDAAADRKHLTVLERYTPEAARPRKAEMVQEATRKLRQRLGVRAL